MSKSFDPVEMTDDEVHFLIHHVFLPPRLPQNCEDAWRLQEVLLQMVHISSNSYSGLVSGPAKVMWKRLTQMFKHLLSIRKDGTLDATRTHKIIRDMKNGDILLLDVAAQNAAVIVRQTAEHLQFESFELSPQSVAVIDARGSLRCCYPGPAVALTVDTAKDPKFLEELCQYLEQMDREPVDEVIPVISSGKRGEADFTDTASPTLITELLTGILRALGREVEIPRIQKRIRDDALNTDTVTPWRRSPLWLAIRVALQTTLPTREDYKTFMVYFMADILQLAIKKNVRGCFLFVMNAKLARRMYKSLPNRPFVTDMAKLKVSAAMETNKARWKKYQATFAKRAPWTPDENDLDADTKLSMTNSSPYLDIIMAKEGIDSRPIVFNPEHFPRKRLSDINLPTRRALKARQHERYVALADLEQWVETSLEPWLLKNIDIDEEDCISELAEILKDYHTAARAGYDPGTENASIMILTAMELWIAIDRMTLKRYPLLKNYPPDIDVNLLEPLLLPRRSQLERLHKIEEYIKARKTNALEGYSSVFSEQIGNDTFAIRYFNSSAEQKTTLDEIKAHAEARRTEKIQELGRMMGEYNKKKARRDMLHCAGKYNRRGNLDHSGLRCERCELNFDLEQMVIYPYALPLPSEELQAKFIVFELQCPLGFSEWRNATYEFLVGLCTPQEALNKVEQRRPSEKLLDSPSLETWATDCRTGHRVTMTSTKKSKAGTQAKRLPKTQEEIIIPNTSTYSLFDDVSARWAAACMGKCDVSSLCKMTLPEGPYKALEYTVNGSSHCSNEIIAKQSECSQTLSLHEFYAFGTLRAGHRIQAINVLRELRARTVNLNSVAVQMLILAAIWQAGPPLKSNDTRKHIRESYVEFATADFGEALLSEIGRVWDSIESNWREDVTASTLIQITCRLLSLTADPTVHVAGRTLLRRARQITLGWTRALTQQLQDCEREETLRVLQVQALKMAGTCRQTYDFEQMLLDDDFEDLGTFVECAMIVHDNTPPKSEGVVRAMLDRDRRLSHAFEEKLRNAVLRDHEPLDDSISKIWSAYRPGEAWQALNGQTNRWITSKTAGGDNAEPLPVQFNVLSGQLLISGLPLGRLPLAYTEDATFKRIFGQKILDVNPADMAGMFFQLRRELHGHQVYFSMRDEVVDENKRQQLVIRTKTADGDVHELISHEKFREDFPHAFVDDYFHWVNIDSGEIELRPVSAPWTTAENNWRISYEQPEPENLVSRLYRGAIQVLDVRSGTAKMIAGVLSPLDDEYHALMTYDTKSERVSVSLPRLKLDFFINEEGELECRQFRGMIVDSNQDIKTLAGLASKLVMKLNSSTQETSGQRKVIIPQGSINTQRLSGYVKVIVSTGNGLRVPYTTYDVDTKLGRLVGNGSTNSRLYLIYLHAITSYFLPDPLTKRTGTEEALTYLRSAATKSFQKLEPGDVELLKLIGALTPTRSYFPLKTKAMQNVEWNKFLPTLSQHEEFYELVAGVFEHDQKFDVFREDKKIKFSPKGSEQLRLRAAARNAVFRVDEFGGKDISMAKDKSYITRDCVREDSKEFRVCQLSKLVNQWSTNLDVTQDMMNDLLMKWAYLSGANDDFRIGYSPRWLSKSLNDVWISLYNALCKCDEAQKYSVMFMLATMAYADIDTKTLHTLLAFATSEDFKDENLKAPPAEYTSYNLNHGFQVSASSLISIVRAQAIYFTSSPESRLPLNNGESAGQHYARRRKAFDNKVDQQAKALAEALAAQWPTSKPRVPANCHSFDHLNVDLTVRATGGHFKSRFGNRTLKRWAARVQDCLTDLAPGQSHIRRYILNHAASVEVRYRPFTGISLDSLFQSEDELNLPDTPVVSRPGEAPRKRRITGHGGWGQDQKLKNLIGDIAESNAFGFHLYAQHLQDSLLKLRDQPRSTHGGRIPPLGSLRADLQEFAEHVVVVFDAIEKHLIRQAKKVKGAELVLTAGVCPRITPTSLLRFLASDKRKDLKEYWTLVLISYGRAITYLQRAERLLECAAREDLADFVKEAENTGGDGWDVFRLLLEIENNIMIRPVQASIATEMINPSSGENSVFQLNMGEGKSSVIVPMVASALANGEMLVRVVVLKPLASQMFHLLKQRLGGLVSRPIFFMPFSRSAEVDLTKAQLIFNLYNQCMKVGGILLVQPEHILSFKLMGLERLVSEGADRDVAQSLATTQRWLEQNSRDILDESDEILHVKYQLIYTLGAQRSIEFAPDRWLILQQIFGLIREHAPTIRAQFPQGIELQESAPVGSFPSTRILQEDAGLALFQKVSADVCAGRLPTVSFRLFPEALRALVAKYITNPNISDEESMALVEHCRANGSTMSTLLLLRGLLSSQILMHALGEKRWRVDYGLDTSRSMLAVPYRAKDSPSVRSEYSHPDISISLTCLTYYYNGLTPEQIKACFNKMIRLDNPTTEFEHWIDGCAGLPGAVRHLNGINLDDAQQFEEVLYPSFKHNKAVIDFHLAQTVFPKEAKEFPKKLPASGWDLAARDRHPKTGFSGTNDNRYLLPTSMNQQDLPEQSSTNAKVLGYLLQDENNHYICAKKENGERLPVADLFKLVAEQEPKIRVVLDVGAQVLELKNREVAELWLSLVPTEEVQAAVYFTEEDELTVVSRDGHTEPLLVSSFAKQMDQVVVYLDEAHTRGTDLRLPTEYRAAVMLGPMLTKDRLTQACMRMRKLGQGQSVAFFAPHEVHQKIQNLSKKDENEPVEVADIIRWVIQETCTGTRNSIPLWANQGISFQRRQSAWEEFCSMGSNDTATLAQTLLEREAQTLEELYGIQHEDVDPLAKAQMEFPARRPDLDLIQLQCNMFRVTSLAQVRAQEEQEREIEHEAEREYQIERPPPVEPLKEFLHNNVRHLVETGEVRPNQDAFFKAFNTLLLTTAEHDLDDSWPSNLLVTACFMSTVKRKTHEKMDEYIRPVNWVLSTDAGFDGAEGPTLVVLSPYEVNKLLPTIRKSNKVRLHVYASRVTKAMMPFDLVFFTMGRNAHIWYLPDTAHTLLHELNIFAGQLFLKDQTAYGELCDFLGLWTQETAGDNVVQYIQADGFVGRDAREFLNIGRTCPFLDSQVEFLRKLVSFRRKQQDYWATHMGQILHGRLLGDRDFGDVQPAPAASPPSLNPPSPSLSSEAMLSEGSGNAKKRRRVPATPAPRKKRASRVKAEPVD